MNIQQNKVTEIVADGALSPSPAEVWALVAPGLAGMSRVRIGVARKSQGKIRWEYPKGCEQNLGRLPSSPAAVRVYNADGECRALFFDFDSNKADPFQVEDDAQNLLWLCQDLGICNIISDISPNGGRHVYLPLDGLLDQPTARTLVEAIALRFTTLDPGPHRSTISGCCRVAGSKHKQDGHQQLVTPWGQVRLALTDRNPVTLVVAQLQREFAAEISAWEAKYHAEADDPDGDTVIAVTRSKFKTQTLRILRDGDTQGFKSPSEAVRSALCAIINRGYTFAAFIAKLHNGTWPGLAGLFANKEPSLAKRRKRIKAEWDRAYAWVATNAWHSGKDLGVSDVHISDTSLPYTHRGGPKGVAHDAIRTWTTKFMQLEKSLPASVRIHARSMAEAAHRIDSLIVDFGVRSHGVADGVSHETAAKAMHKLEGLGWLTKVADAKGRDADRWCLTIPDNLENTGKLRWHPGKPHALRPAFLELGMTAALVFEAVEMGRATTITELVQVTGFCRSAVTKARNTLLAWQLLERRNGRLVAYPDRLAQVGEYLGCDETQQAQIAKYRQQRRIWHAYLDRFTQQTEIQPADIIEDWLPLPGDTWQPYHWLTRKKRRKTEICAACQVLLPATGQCDCATAV